MKPWNTNTAVSVSPLSAHELLGVQPNHCRRTRKEKVEVGSCVAVDGEAVTTVQRENSACRDSVHAPHLRCTLDQDFSLQQPSSVRGSLMTFARGHFTGNYT